MGGGMSENGALPTTHVLCQWCGGGMRAGAARCGLCGLAPSPVEKPKTRATSKTKPATGTAKATARTGKSRKSNPRSQPLAVVPVGQPVIGVDPGARYTGVVIRDGDVVLHASTLLREKDVDAVAWARQVVADITVILADLDPMPMGIEGVSDPKGFTHGNRDAINPAHIMRAAVVLGAVAQAFPSAVIIAPGGNGSQHVSHYPASLRGRRPGSLPGTTSGGTRGHEQSAYDVAGKAAAVLYPPPPLRDTLRAAAGSGGEPGTVKLAG